MRIAVSSHCAPAERAGWLIAGIPMMALSHSWSSPITAQSPLGEILRLEW